MNLSVIYCTHQTAQLSVRERLAFPNADTLSRGYQSLKQLGEQLEAVILSTCNRVEIYVAQPPTGTVPSLDQVATFLAEIHQLPQQEFASELRELTGPAAVKHLFDVVSSLDSMVLGEPQIVNQVKEAYRVAEANEACGPLTHALFQGAIRASSRVRTETRLSEGRVSIASVAVGDFARSIFDHFSDKLVLIIGAGEMAEETLRYLKDEGVRDVVVINRSPERAARLAAEWGGVAAAWNELDHWLGRADVIVSTTGADKPIIDAGHFQRVRHEHRDRTTFILDLGAPRDFDPAIGKLENIFLYDIDSLQRTCEDNRRARVREIGRAGAIIEDETQKFIAEYYRKSSGDLVSRLRAGWHDLAQQELERLFRKSPHFTAEDRESVKGCVDRIVNKLLHPPLEALRDESRDGAPQGLIAALKRLFGV